ncbi:unnamed protein product [Camellia sinensis]
MNQKFGGRRQPSGTPSLAWSCVVVVVSLLSGASIVHNIFKPDLKHCHQLTVFMGPRTENLTKDEHTQYLRQTG